MGRYCTVVTKWALRCPVQGGLFMHRNPAYAGILLIILTYVNASGREGESWESQYAGEDANGPHVIAYWNCDGEGDVVADVSGKGHDGTLQGAARRPDGKIGGAIESFAGWPVEDVCHRLQVKNAFDLSPRSAFTIEMWICPTEAFDKYEEAFIVDKKYVADTDYQWVLERPDSLGRRTMRVCLGFGNDSATWWSESPADFTAGVWSHIAFSYDGAGEVQFFQNGHTLGRERQEGRGSICPGDHFLSLGDRVGSYHHGFPGRLDEIRITEGIREFRPLALEAEQPRSVFMHMEAGLVLRFRVTNLRDEAVTGVAVSINIAGAERKDYEVPHLEAGASQVLEYPVNTRLRPDDYGVVVDCRMAVGPASWSDREVFKITIVPRRPPRMPVVMWGLGGVDGVLENMAALKDIGFTHCLGLNCDYQRIWDGKAVVPAVDGKVLAASHKMLDQALANDIGVIISLGVGHWLEEKTDLLRIDRSGTAYERGNICCNFPELASFAYNVGASVAQTFGDFPAFESALINTEVRDGSQLCFHEHDRAAYRAASGKEIPDVATGKSGIHYEDIAGFPASRVVPDDDPLLQFYRWFWREGDGWNGLHSAVNNGLKSTGRPGLWTFFDPVVRVPPLWGSGGNVDFLSHWTYSYPDPIRIGLATDELLAMAQGGPDGQGVMKMTQIIWYRSQTAPVDESAKSATGSASPWEDRDPDAAYITIAPAHLREAFWTKIARPIQGIMYHGWQSLVQTKGGGAYRFTHPDTRDALKELVATVVRPLGPALLQVPEAPTDVAFLESFTSSMFAGRGTYGWGGSWAGDAYHILLYAHLQPRVLYEETIVKSGLEGYRVLVLAASVVERIQAFQQAGGIVVGDERLCPAITPDVLLEVYSRTGKADADKTALLERARRFREELDVRYERYLDASLPEVITYRRSYGNSDYVFLANDRREYGDYVGRHGLVMENGLPANGRIAVRRANGFVYDLVAHREVETQCDGTLLDIPIDLEPAGGRVWLITEKQFDKVEIMGPDEVPREAEVTFDVSIKDGTGTPVNAVVPVELLIQDPNGRPGEFSGFYGAADGRLSVSTMIAPNDTPGVWTVTARELASGKTARYCFRVTA